eukprot:1956838-Prymnesium_polylepis.1
MQHVLLLLLLASHGQSAEAVRQNAHRRRAAKERALCRVQGCWVCNAQDRDSCAQCKEGFVLTPSRTCVPCAAGCARCRSAGAGSCDPAGCKARHVLVYEPGSGVAPENWDEDEDG